MVKTTLVVTSLFALALHAPAQAQNARTFVSANGSDLNTCARTQPCRTFQAAHDKTNTGGEINVLDPAGYGVVTITKSISIVNDGVGSAGILVPANQVGVNIDADDAVVNLRGLIIEGSGIGDDGILFGRGKSLTVENCVVRNLNGNGLSLIPSVSGSLKSIAVTNSDVANNGAYGIVVQPSGSGTLKAVFNRVAVYSNGFAGLLIQSGDNVTMDATVTDSIAGYNLTGGFGVGVNLGAAPAALMVARSLVVGNGERGLLVDNAILRLAQSTVTGNDAGWQAFFGAVLSYGDNYIDGNAGEETAPPFIPRK
ncbi:MAG: hypothetical protein QOI12_2454 [Alphaproteobacteria bacterium]|nr:hypothetical protein [Alphaproteobacteria bacterium]